MTPPTASTPTSTPPLSLRAYGRHRKALGLPGGNPVAVSRAIATQRLVASVVLVDGVAQISDPTLADQEWQANTDHSKAPSYVKTQADAVTAGSSVTRRAVTPGAPAVPSTVLSQASAREKNAKADLAELEFLERAGKLVRADDVERAWSELVTQVRTAVLAVPSKAKLALPHTSHADMAIWADLLTKALESLTDDKSGARGAAA